MIIYHRSECESNKIDNANFVLVWFEDVDDDCLFQLLAFVAGTSCFKERNSAYQIQSERKT